MPKSTFFIAGYFQAMLQYINQIWNRLFIVLGMSIKITFYSNS